MEGPRLAITVGDPSGIGPEVVLKALADPVVRAACRPLVVGSLDVLRRTQEDCRLHLPLQAANGTAAGGDGSHIPVVEIGGAGAGFQVGKVSAEGGRAAWACIEAGVRLCMAGQADALVTAPINKQALEMAGLGHTGHTEILQRMTASPWSLTMFVVEQLRALFLSRHLSLREAIDYITAERVCRTLERFSEVSSQVGLHSPRLAVAALNPHAGEGGLFGREEMEQIGPGIEMARRKGIDVAGPIPADAVFYLAREGLYDAVLSLYHDQASAILKSIDFHGTVSITLGLPFLRFSVDHGTALDIAGQNRADARNMRNVLLVAAATPVPARQPGGERAR